MGDLSSDDEEKFDAAPVLGYPDTRWEYVDGFYKYWDAFTSKKSFASADKHDLREAPDRKVMRNWEKENKRLRREARRWGSEHVRELVSFVKRRDPRVTARLAEDSILQP